jgi:hypothetical protein
MLRAAAFNGGEAAPVMDDVDGVALQCRGRSEKVRGESIWTERERARSCSPIMADGDGAQAGTREEEGLRWREPARWACRRWRKRGARAQVWTRNRAE